MLNNALCPIGSAAVLLLSAVVVAAYALPTVERRAADAALHGSLLPFTAVTESWTLRDPTGQRRAGRSSFYARRFTGRIMADGTTADPQGDIAASKWRGSAVRSPYCEVALPDSGV